MKVGELRGRAVALDGERTLIVTYHPAAAMRFPAQREPFHADLAEAVRRSGLG